MRANTENTFACRLATVNVARIPKSCAFETVVFDCLVTPEFNDLQRLIATVFWNRDAGGVCRLATFGYSGFRGGSNHLARFNSLFFQGEEELSSDSRIALTDSPLQKFPRLRTELKSRIAQLVIYDCLGQMVFQYQMKEMIQFDVSKLRS